MFLAMKRHGLMEYRLRLVSYPDLRFDFEAKLAGEIRDSGYLLCKIFLQMIGPQTDIVHLFCHGYGTFK